MSNFVLSNYISGVQTSLVENGYVKYASEEQAQADNQALAAGLDQEIPAAAGGEEMDNAALLEEGMPEEGNLEVAKAVQAMAAELGEDAAAVQAKAQIIADAAAQIGGNEKVASVIVVSGQGKGTPKAETSVSSEQELATQVETDQGRTSERALPGTVADLGKGMVGSEEAGEASATLATSEVTEQELATQVDTDQDRVHASSAPGTEADSGKGMVGTEEKTAGHVNDVLAALNNL